MNEIFSIRQLLAWVRNFCQKTEFFLTFRSVIPNLFNHYLFHRHSALNFFYAKLWPAYYTRKNDCLQNLVETPDIHASERLEKVWDDGLNSSPQGFTTNLK